MIGFDRPLKPHWIYETLLLATPGQRLNELNAPFEKIVKELTGKEGKRKVRTVLFRCFLRDPEKRGRVREHLLLKEMSLELGETFMLPIYLFYLVGSTSILYRISEHLFRLYSFEREINTRFLKQHLVNQFGDRDVVKKATGAFMRTLSYFGILEHSNKSPYLKKRFEMDENQIRNILAVYSKEILCSPQINLNDLPHALFNYFSISDLKDIAQKNNGTYWDYQQRAGSHLLIVY